MTKPELLDVFTDDGSYDPVSFSAVDCTFTLQNCDMGNSTYDGLECIKFVNCKNAPDNSNFLGSLIGNGSLTMIFSLLALIVSVATAGAFISWKQKKTAFAGVNGSADGENKHA